MKFSEFLLEGGAATAKYDVSRASKSDIEKALRFVSKTLSIPYETLKSNVLGSVELTLLGYKEDSGDIDIAIPKDAYDKKAIHTRMMAAVSNEGKLFPLGFGSYAVPIGKKKVQVDLMYVPNVKWAKFAYQNELGRNSKFNNLIRNELLTCLLHHKLVPGEDVVIKDEAGDVVARASRSYKWDSGVERLFKATRNRKDGAGRTKGMEKMHPDQLEQELKTMGHDVKFSKSADVITDPDQFAELLFGKGTKSTSIDTTEKLIKMMKKKLDEKTYNAVMKEATGVLYKRQQKEQFEMPREFEVFK